MKQTLWLSEPKDKLPANIVSEIQGKIDALKEALKGTHLPQINKAKDELNTHMQKIGEAMQASAGQGPGPQSGANAQASSKKPEMEEAEVEILNDSDKK
jgi:molecular chaperone DnaK